MDAGKILAECYGDTLLTKQLKYEYFARHSGIGEVANQMKKYYVNRKAIAIIDDDKKGKPTYFTSECFLIEQKNGVILMKHKTADHYVIKITPGLEDFIINAAISCKLELFEKDKKKFKAIVKDSKLHSNQEFVAYLNKIVQKNPPEIQTLRKYIEKAKSEPLTTTSSHKKTKTSQQGKKTRKR
ncbi:MAG: hypothetical protein JWO06_3152 [Bacteroidota bacterium]|nr:hypothetical protein [Bacteroidota bacterium]